MRNCLKHQVFKEGGQLEFAGRTFKILTPDESVSSILKVIGGLPIESSGSFLDYDGEPLPF